MEIVNWKLKEILNYIEVIGDNSNFKFQHDKMKMLNLPKKINDMLSLDTTSIEWMKMPIYYRFFLDGYDEIIVESAFRNSVLNSYESIIMVNGWNPAVKLPTELFFEDWEGFIAGMDWSGFIFSDDYKFIVEFSQNNFHAHSNFEILPNSKVST